MTTGLVIYARQASTLARFYQEVFGFSLVESEEGYALLKREGAELVVLETAQSKQAAADGPRESAALKPVFFSDATLESLRKKISQHGGSLYAPKNWTFGNHTVCDGHDCEGNVFQLRVPVDA